MNRRRRLLTIAACVVAALLLPGWRGRLEPVAHERILAAARSAAPSSVFGVSRAGERPGETWHAQYHDSLTASLLRRAGMGASLPCVVPPAFAAHIAVGAERADGYFRVVTARHWPWWWPGGGVAWQDPRVAARGDDDERAR